MQALHGLSYVMTHNMYIQQRMVDLDSKHKQQPADDHGSASMMQDQFAENQ
jgi:hypothetical protein